MEENEKTASEIARGIHPRGYGAIMSFTGTREFTARVNGLSFRAEHSRRARTSTTSQCTGTGAAGTPWSSP